MINFKTISVVGAGLSGSECALQLASLGYKVHLYEMRGQTMTPAHKTNYFAELVCSNSFGSLNEVSAPGQLKWEAEQLNSFILAAAKTTQVPAGQALGVDRDKFAQSLSSLIRQHPNITVCEERIVSLAEIPRPAVIATGPLTDEALSHSMQLHFGQDFLYFFDAIAPIIDAESIDYDTVFRADRYDKGTPDYLNCPMNKEQYFQFIEAVTAARKIEPKDFEKTSFFEGCMPIEVMVDRGPQTLRFGPMKPVGLTDPKTGRYPFAAVQLRQENREATAYNMVGFQTRMAYGEQTRVFRMIPGLEKAEFLKLGSIHRNLFINTPLKLSCDLSSRKDPWLFFAGQITGVEGYFESTCIGLLVARLLHQKIQDRPMLAPPRVTAFGSLLNAITDEKRAAHFQPTNMNFSMFPPLAEESGVEPKINALDKTERKKRQIELARTALSFWKSSL